MEMLVLGLVLWVGIHMVPVVLPSIRDGLVTKFGKLPYKGAFALCILSSVGLIILGWRSIDSVSYLYEIPSWGMPVALLLLLSGFVLMSLADFKSNMKRVIRHLQLVGFTMWAFAHLLVNGDLRTTALFATMGIWALTSIVLLNKRDGAFQKPPLVAAHNTIKGVALGFGLFIAAVLGHVYFTGVDLTQVH